MSRRDGCGRKACGWQDCRILCRLYAFAMRKDSQPGESAPPTGNAVRLPPNRAQPITSENVTYQPRSVFLCATRLADHWVRRHRSPDSRWVRRSHQAAISSIKLGSLPPLPERLTRFDTGHMRNAVSAPGFK